MGEGAREEANEEATMALARESAVSWGMRLVVDSVGPRVTRGFRSGSYESRCGLILGLASALDIEIDSDALRGSRLRGSSLRGEGNLSTAEVYDDSEELVVDLSGELDIVLSLSSGEAGRFGCPRVGGGFGVGLLRDTGV